MERALTLYSTSVGKKVAMALSGAILLLFVIGHLAGNLNIYAGPEALDGYTAMLHEHPGLLWTARLGLIAAFGTHVVTAAMLFVKNRQARPTRYAKKKDIAADYASKTMYLTGPILFFYVIYHLAHLTFRNAFGLYEWNETSLYANVYHGFQLWPIIVPYMLGNLCLGIHLFHGIYSMFQSLGASHPKYDHLRRDLAVGLATLLTIGNLSIPLAVKFGLVQPPPGDAAAEEAEEFAAAQP